MDDIRPMMLYSHLSDNWRTAKGSPYKIISIINEIDLCGIVAEIPCIS